MVYVRKSIRIGGNAFLAKWAVYIHQYWMLHSVQAADPDHAAMPAHWVGLYTQMSPENPSMRPMKTS
jgi:hypothetical protein